MVRCPGRREDVLHAAHSMAKNGFIDLSNRWDGLGVSQDVSKPPLVLAVIPVELPQPNSGALGRVIRSQPLLWIRHGMDGRAMRATRCVEGEIVRKVSIYSTPPDSRPLSDPADRCQTRPSLRLD